MLHFKAQLQAFFSLEIFRLNLRTKHDAKSFKEIVMQNVRASFYGYIDCVFSQMIKRVLKVIMIMMRLMLSTMMMTMTIDAVW